MSYQLPFIRDDDLFQHVKNTVAQYRFQINLKKFNKNLIDPIKLTFDSKVYQHKIEQIIENEVLRQLDKSNTNLIGYFHQNIFKYIRSDKWKVLDKKGFDIINSEENIYVEMKNKHNTMNSSSAARTYIRMQKTLVDNENAKCYLVEVIAHKSQDISWILKIDNEIFFDERIRRISIDRFYSIVTGIPDAFKQLCAVLPEVLDNVLADISIRTLSNTVFSELIAINPNLLKSLYLFAFKNYEGFDETFTFSRND